jgi:hypothetical protein
VIPILSYWYSLIIFENQLKVKLKLAEKILMEKTSTLSEKEFSFFKKNLIKNEKSNFRRNLFFFNYLR